MLRLPYITLGVLVSPQDTTVSWQSDTNLAGTLVTQYQKNLIDITTTMVLYPGYMRKNVKKDEDVGLDDLHQSLLT